ncbi:MAG: SDR family oxidoreductase [Streptosporangiaceae bacterium]
MPSLDGKVALITGGGTGIGAAIAMAFAGAGARVAVTGRRPGPLEQTAGQIVAAGGTTLTIPADVADLDAMTGAVGTVLDRFGKLDIVVANAGIMLPDRPVLEYPPGDWQQVLDTNLTGVWNTARVTVPALTDAGGGSIVVVGSGMARVSAGGSGPYAVAKAGASALVRVLAAELRESRIAVNELVPGPTRTPGAGGGSDDAEFERRWRQRGEWLKDPDEVARLALFVACLPPDGPTGQVFSLAGRLL